MKKTIMILLAAAFIMVAASCKQEVNISEADLTNTTWQIEPEEFDTHDVIFEFKQSEVFQIKHNIDAAPIGKGSYFIIDDMLTISYFDTIFQEQLTYCNKIVKFNKEILILENEYTQIKLHRINN